MGESHAILGTYDLQAEIERFTPDPAGASGRRAETLIKADGLRVVLVTLRAGASLHEHAAPAPITIHCLRGAIAVSVGESSYELAGHGLISIAAGARHAVTAREESAFLLTIGGNQEPDI
jgi:quercetin dioxygenase-like cupin family protein